MVDVESIEQKLEQNEKIIQIFSESLPHLSTNSTTDNNTRRLLSTPGTFTNTNNNNTNTNTNNSTKNPQQLLANANSQQQQQQQQQTMYSSQPVTNNVREKKTFKYI